MKLHVFLIVLTYYTRKAHLLLLRLPQLIGQLCREARAQTFNDKNLSFNRLRNLVKCRRK